MTKTVVHVTTLEQWKSVLDVWFKHGYGWYKSGKVYNERYFNDGKRYLLLDEDYDILISSDLNRGIIEYSEFMTQQKEDNMTTIYVTKEQFNLIERIKEYAYPLSSIAIFEDIRVALKNSNFNSSTERKILRYLGGDETIEFKVKEPLYRLWRIDDVDDKVYMIFTSSGNPDWTMNKDVAFTATQEEIKKWQTPAWEIEKVE